MSERIVPESEINRVCPECGTVGISARQLGNGYNMHTGEIVPQWCPACGANMKQRHWGNVTGPPLTWAKPSMRENL